MGSERETMIECVVTCTSLKYSAPDAHPVTDAEWSLVRARHLAEDMAKYRAEFERTAGEGRQKMPTLTLQAIIKEAQACLVIPEAAGSGSEAGRLEEMEKHCLALLEVEDLEDLHAVASWLLKHRDGFATDANCLAYFEAYFETTAAVDAQKALARTTALNRLRATQRGLPSAGPLQDVPAYQAMFQAAAL